MISDHVPKHQMCQQGSEELKENARYHLTTRFIDLNASDIPTFPVLDEIKMLQCSRRNSRNSKTHSASWYLEKKDRIRFSDLQNFPSIPLIAYPNLYINVFIERTTSDKGNKSGKPNTPLFALKT
jgi:hypothetical protein